MHHLVSWHQLAVAAEQGLELAVIGSFEVAARQMLVAMQVDPYMGIAWDASSARAAGG